MSLRIYNTLSRTKEEFQPVKPDEVTIYLCGPTVYKESHIGHLVGPIIFDALKRYLQSKGYKVKLVVNITDVEDKLIAQAKTEGVEITALAERITELYFGNLRELGAFDSVDVFPKATESIEGIIELTRGLIDKGLAYAVDGDVYFEVAKFEGYGKLSGRKLEDQLAGTRQLQGKAWSPGDFVLWKESGPDEPGWDSPWGRGRPGWHIECSVMSMQNLAETIDIHGGGRDLIFPHHENEIAQSEGYSGKCFVKYWMHNGLTRVPTKVGGGEWQKMSKSLGNIKPIREALQAHDGQTVRFFVLSTHYRRPIPYSDQALDDAAKALGYFYELFSVVENSTGVDPYTLAEPSQNYPKLGELGDWALQRKTQFLEHLDDDFNTAGAIGVLFDLARKTRNLASHEGTSKDGLLWLVSLILQMGRLLGMFQSRPAGVKKIDAADEKLVEELIEQRNLARKEKDFDKADAIRGRLTDMGVSLEDLPGGKTIWHM